MKSFLIPALLTVLFGCGVQDAVPMQGAVVDSILPVNEEIRRFKSSRNDIAAASLTDGATSRDELVNRFSTALERNDTAQLARLVLNAAEFIDLYYPSSMFARPPYKQSPEVRWLLLQEQSNKGLARLLRRYGGQATGIRTYTCAGDPVIEGPNRLWDRCVLHWDRQPSSLRAFSTIIERDGRFKFVSYANDL